MTMRIVDVEGKIEFTLLRIRKFERYKSPGGAEKTVQRAYGYLLDQLRYLKDYEKKRNKRRQPYKIKD